MTQTVVSGLTPYCIPSQVTARYDWRTLSRLLSDGTTPLATQAAVEQDTKLALFLKESSGGVEMACARGGRYSTADLQALAGSNAGEQLAGLVADLTAWRCYDRRPDRNAEIPPRCLQALKVLAELESGALIWPMQETEDAGVMDDLTMTTHDIEQGNGTVIQASRFFGTRAYEMRGPF